MVVRVMVRPAARLAAVMLILSGFALGSPAMAQVQTGSILVRSADQQNAAMPGVTVTISSPVLVGGKIVGATDSGGAYRFPALPPGTFTVQFELQGFQTLIREGIVVSVGQTTPIDGVLRVATLAETVTVTGASPTIDTTSANVNVTLSQQLLQGTPGGRDIWSLVEYKVPGLVTNRPDVGGSAGGLQASFSARGTPNGQNAQFLNGINVGDPAAIGFTQFYYDYEAFDEIQVSTGAHDLSVPSSGVFLNMVTKTGGDRFSGKGSMFWQGNQTQGTNVDADLGRFGFRQDAGAVDYISDANFQAGGPIVANKLRFFTSFRDWRVHVNVPGFPEIEETNISSGIGSVTYQVNQNHRLTGFGSRQYYKKPNRGANALNTPQSNWNEDDVTAIYQALWNAVLSKNSFMDARVSFNNLLFPLYLKNDEQSLLDLSTNIRTRSNTNGFEFERRRLQASANFQYYLDQALGGRHELRWGIDHAYAPTKTAVVRVDDVNLTYRSQPVPTASTVTLFNSPVNSRSNVDVTALYLQDSYSVKRLTVSGGVRWERVEGYLPEQESPPSRWFTNATRQFSQIDNIPNWQNAAPRFTAAYDLFGTGRTALKAAAGRYYYTLSTGTPNSVNPNFTSGETYAWNDRNGDLVFQAGEAGAFQGRFGGLITSFDPDVRRTRTDELSASLDHELLPNMKLSVVFTHRRERDNFGSLDVGVPASAYTSVSRVDEGRDGMAGTADDQTLTVFAQDPATLGRNQFLITNSSLYDQDHRSLEMTATKRFSDRWQMLAGWTIAKTEQELDPGQVFNNPNNLINAGGPIFFDRTHVLKLTGSYLLPWDISLASNFRTQTGVPIARFATFSGLPQGNVTVNAEPRGSERLDYLTTLDLRASKSFQVSGNKSLEAMVDVYNVSNANTTWEVRTLTGRFNAREGGEPTGALINQAQFLSPTQILGPRILRLGVSYRW